MGQFYGIKNGIFALSKHFFSQGGAPGGPLKNLNFFGGIYFWGPTSTPKSEKIGKNFFWLFLLHKKEYFFLLVQFFLVHGGQYGTGYCVILVSFGC